MYEARRPLPDSREPMTAGLHTRLQRAVLMETLTSPASADIRDLCQRLVYEEDADAAE
jgi:hypothetical protein